MKAMLVLRSGTQKGRETNLAQGIYLVGRSKACQIRPKNKSVSRKHCAIIVSQAKVEVRDVGSKTGTFINGKKIVPNLSVEISNSDKLQVGRTRFRFSLIDEKAVSAKESEARSGAEHAPKKRVKQEVAGLRAKVAKVTGQEQDAGRELVAVGAESVAVPVVESQCPSHDEARNAAPMAKQVESSTAAAVDGAPDCVPPDDQDSVVEESVGVRVVAEASTGQPNHEMAAVQHTAEDILQLLDDEEATRVSQREFQLDAGMAAESNVELDLDSNSDSDVDFVAPISGEEVKSGQDVPSYQLRQDWDVQGVHKWVASGSSGQTATKNLPAAKASSASSSAKPVGKAEAAAFKRPAASPKTNGFAALDGDMSQMLIVGAAGLLFAAWVVWNAWRLYSFNG